jgi:hypothetical protein
MQALPGRGGRAVDKSWGTQQREKERESNVVRYEPRIGDT